MGIPTLAGNSILHFGQMAASHTLHLRHGRIGHLYRVEDGGRYAIFRESVSTAVPSGIPTVLVVGFRLKLIRSSRLMHWLFQRLCIFTTPFWSGFKGFGTKLWMVDPVTKNYLGIYQWYGTDEANTYVTALTKVLLAVSTDGSVWHNLYPNTGLEPFLQAHA